MQLWRSVEPPSCSAATRSCAEEPGGIDVATTMNRLLPVLLLCVACNTTTTTPTSDAPSAAGDLHIQVVRLENTRTNEVAKVLEETLASEFASGRACKVAVEPHQNALILSGTTEQIQVALNLVARLDSRSAR